MNEQLHNQLLSLYPDKHTASHSKYGDEYCYFYPVQSIPFERPAYLFTVCCAEGVECFYLWKYKGCEIYLEKSYTEQSLALRELYLRITGETPRIAA